jgi:rare lipoprotein A
VQVGAFSTRANAERAARQVGGTVSPAGQLFRVRIAGFATADQAAGALAKARGAGYSDARIQRAD